MLDYIILVPLCYFIGALPWGYILVRVTKGVDIRSYGSGRTGMANVLRTVGGRVAAAVVVLDTGKGILAVIIAKLLTDSPIAETVAGLLAVVGHNWTVFLRFKGGRGLTVGGGALIGMAPLTFLPGLAVFLTVTLASRYISLASIATLVTSVISVAAFAFTGFYDMAYFYYILPACSIILWQHRDNIVRLLKGTERKLGQRAERLVLSGSAEKSR